MPKKPPRDNPLPFRSRRGPASAADVLARMGRPRSPLAQLDQGVSVSQSLRERVLARVPEALRPHVREVLEKPGEAVVFTESAAWAARLKLELAEGTPLQAAGGTPLKLTVRVMPTGRLRR